MNGDAVTRRGPRVRPVDFSRPTKFTTEHERRLTGATDAFCRAASQRLSAELRVPLELEVVNTSQLNWSNAHDQLPQGSVCAVLAARPTHGMLLLSAELPLILAVIDLLLGGSLGGAQLERRLSEIDWELARHFFGSLAAQLSVIWSDLAGVTFDVAALDSPLETAQVAPVSEPTLSLTLECRLGEHSWTGVLLVPHGAVAAMLATMAADDAHHRAADGALAEVVDAAVREVEVDLRAEVAAVELAAEEVLALRPGSLLRLQAPAAAGGTLYADGVPVCSVRLGRSGRRRAVQVQGAPTR